MNENRPTKLEELPREFNEEIQGYLLDATRMSSLELQSIEIHSNTDILVSNGNEWLQIDIEAMEGEIEVKTLRPPIHKELTRSLLDYKSKTLNIASVYPVFIRFANIDTGVVSINRFSKVFNTDSLFFGDCTDLLPNNGVAKLLYNILADDSRWGLSQSGEFSQIEITHNLGNLGYSVDFTSESLNRVGFVYQKLPNSLVFTGDIPRNIEVILIH